jgi:mRNA-degrading endonuclease RelE of RelBE toxin-antitoxin system
VDKWELIYAPRAQRDLLKLPKRFALQILNDLELLKNPPWPAGKVKKLRGHDFHEIKTGDFRTLFWPRGQDLVILRVIARRDLQAAIGRIDIRAVRKWLGENREP